MRTRILGNGRRNVRYSVAAAALALTLSQPHGAQGAKREPPHNKAEVFSEQAQLGLVSRLDQALSGNHSDSGFRFRNAVATGGATIVLALLAAEEGIHELSAARFAPAGAGRLFLTTNGNPDVVRVIRVDDDFRGGPKAEMRRPRGVDRTRFEKRAPPFRNAQIIIRGMNRR